MGLMRITMLGDSLTAGYGLRTREALPVRLQAQLDGLGLASRVTNAGVSGDTTADGLRRVDRDVPSDTRLCIVALGANDMMLGRPTERIARNLDGILKTLAARAIPTLICGMRAPPWFGLYAIAFDSLFAEVARRHRAPIYPFLLDGVALNPEYALPDRIHPNAKGVEVIARRLAPHVARAVACQPSSET